MVHITKAAKCPAPTGETLRDFMTNLGAEAESVNLSEKSINDYRKISQNVAR